jgi:hypothetical protein
VDIYAGFAFTAENGKKSKHPTPHVWNVNKFISQSGEDEEQLVDIYNYKTDGGLKYCDHFDGKNKQ